MPRPASQLRERTARPHMGVGADAEAHDSVERAYRPCNRAEGERIYKQNQVFSRCAESGTGGSNPACRPPESDCHPLPGQLKIVRKVRCLGELGGMSPHWGLGVVAAVMLT